MKSDPIFSVSPNSLFGKRIRTDLKNGRTLTIEFWAPETPDGEIDISVVLGYHGEKDPEDLVVVRAKENDVELLFPSEKEKEKDNHGSPDHQ